MLKAGLEVLHGVGLIQSLEESLPVSFTFVRLFVDSTDDDGVSGMFQGTAFIEILKTGRMVQLAFLYAHSLSKSSES